MLEAQAIAANARLDAEAREREKSRADFDARIQTLTVPHQTLAMNAELLSHYVQQTSAEVRATTANIDKPTRRLANAVEAHKQRHSDLECPPK